MIFLSVINGVLGNLHHQILLAEKAKELAGEHVPKPLANSIRDQHDELLRQQQILAAQRLDRAALDSDLQDALLRYRALKAPPGAAAAKPDAQQAAATSG